MEPSAVLLPHFVVCCTFHAVDSAGSMEMLRREKQLRGWPGLAATEEDVAGGSASGEGGVVELYSGLVVLAWQFWGGQVIFEPRRIERVGEPHNEQNLLWLC